MSLDVAANFFPSTGETQIYRPQLKLKAATQVVQPKLRTVTPNSSGRNPI